MGENLSIQNKIREWLKNHPQYENKSEAEILSAMQSSEDNSITLTELQELSLFAQSSALDNSVLNFEHSASVTKEQENLLKQALFDRLTILDEQIETAKMTAAVSLNSGDGLKTKQVSATAPIKQKNKEIKNGKSFNLMILKLLLKI